MSTSNYESWFEMKAKDRDYRSARPHTEVVRQLLINTVDPTTAATKLISLDYTNGDTPWALWNLVYEAAADFDSSHSSLLALLGEFQKADSHIPGSKAEDKPSEWLACFGSMWRDKWDILSPHALSGWTMSTSQTARRWNNINAFSAKLLATTSFSRGAKLRAFGLASLRRCLETDPNTFKDLRLQTQFQSPKKATMVQNGFDRDVGSRCVCRSTVAHSCGGIAVGGYPTRGT